MPAPLTAVRVAGLAALTSIASATIGLAILPIWDFPATGATSTALTAFLVDHRARLQLMMLMYTLGVTLWLLFGTAAAAHLRQVVGRTDGNAALVRCFAAGISGFVVLLLAGFTAFDVLVYRAPHVPDPGLLYDLGFGLLAMSGMPTALGLGAYALLVHRTGALPRPTIYLAAVTAAAHVVLLLSFIVPSGFFSLEGLVIAAIPALLWAWIVQAGLALLAVRPQRAAPELLNG
ncbi:hypothetical protein [uncultured Jatrophihabitans sp.]|uniref:hypothetical protein n=1 Tax=uncultured Jatrophihabitans sp. TaxID=1610747 RepID=UPI0035CC298F